MPDLIPEIWNILYHGYKQMACPKVLIAIDKINVRLTQPTYDKNLNVY